MSRTKTDVVAAAIDCFDTQYRELGMRSQRSYPNESLIQFIASHYFGMPLEQRREIRVLEVGCGTGGQSVDDGQRRAAGVWA